MGDDIEYGLFLVTDSGDRLIMTTERENELLREIGKLPVVQEHIVLTRTITRGEWQPR